MNKNRITEEQYLTHDCHASPEDGCETCYLYEQQCEQDKKIMDMFSFENVLKQVGEITKAVHGINPYESRETF